MKAYTAGLDSYRTENTAMHYTQQLAQSKEAHFPFDDVINNMWKHELSFWSTRGHYCTVLGAQLNAWWTLETLNLWQLQMEAFSFFNTH